MVAFRLACNSYVLRVFVGKQCGSIFVLLVCMFAQNHIIFMSGRRNMVIKYLMDYLLFHSDFLLAR